MTPISRLATGIGALLVALAPALLWPTAAGAQLVLQETPSLAAAVEAGTLPPVAERLPATPLVMPPGVDEEMGKPGGALRILIERARDVRLMAVFGYARLIGWMPDLTLAPDIAERVDVEEGRIFTFTLRAGHRWSDGQPFTSEDFRYYWEDVANNKKLAPTGLPLALVVAGKPPTVSFPDARTIRYEWQAPNPNFLPEIASSAPLYIFRPAHYLKKFHAKYNNEAELEARAKAAGARSWAQWHNRLDNQYRNDNPDLPTLDPWVNRTPSPAERFVFKRNAYYHRVDTAGQPLPYIDEVDLQVADGRIIPVKTGAGESDLQARNLSFDNYTFLRQAARGQDFEVDLWATGRASHLALYPNLTASDPVWRPLLRDVRLRRALSLAINRRELNQVVYFGLARESGNTAQPGSPFFEDARRTAWSTYDPAQASALLDQMGLTQRNPAGIRLLSDGRPMTLIVEVPSQSAEQSAVLQLIEDSWRRIGVKLFIRGSQVDLFRNRLFAGDVTMSLLPGFDNGHPTAAMSPADWAPTNQQHAQWSRWGNWVESAGKAGEKPDMPEAEALLAAWRRWQSSADEAVRAAAWAEILTINADQQFVIGLVAGVPQPVVINKQLRNVPRRAFFNWEPGAQFGIHRMDRFWMVPPPKRQTPATPRDFGERPPT